MREGEASRRWWLIHRSLIETSQVIAEVIAMGEDVQEYQSSGHTLEDPFEQGQGAKFDEDHARPVAGLSFRPRGIVHHYTNGTLES